MKRILAALFLLLTATPCFAADETPPSLFFSPEETRRIEKERGQHNVEAEETVRLVRLDSILYFSPGHWRIWIQGEQATPSQNPPHIKIHSVTANQVHFTYAPPGEETETDIVLRPHQAYNPATGDIVETR